MPNPGTEWLEDKLQKLEDIGYDRTKIRVTPQDCDDARLSGMMDDMMGDMDVQEADEEEGEEGLGGAGVKILAGLTSLPRLLKDLVNLNKGA